MKYIRIISIILILSVSIYGQRLKPYILAAESNGTIIEVAESVKNNLAEAGFEVLGEYSPANDESRKVIVITDDAIKESVKSFGGLTGFAAALRVALTQEDGTINVTYTNPTYMGVAYFGDKFAQVESNYKSVTEKIHNALATISGAKNSPFGSKDGITYKALKKYRYMVGMQRFDNTVELNEFESFEDAVSVIDGNLVDTDNLVYSIAFPNEKLKLYGIALGGEKGEERFLPIIDITAPKHTAFLPYEILVIDNKAVMLHGRYRIALSFPDLTMMTFGKIMSTPGDIKNQMKGYTN